MVLSEQGYIEGISFKKKSGKTSQECPKVSSICPSEFVRRGPILYGCDNHILFNMYQLYPQVSSPKVPTSPHE